MLDWFAKALDLPDTFLSRASNPASKGGGALQGSASDAIFCSMMAARAEAIRKLRGKDKEKHDSYYLPNLVCYSSTEAHSSVEKAARMCLVELHCVEPDEHDCMRGRNLERAIKEDLRKGKYPFFVVATLGTTSQAAFDNIYEIGMVCQEIKNIWFHVDGAYGGNALILPEMRHFKKGMEMVDSFEINPNKLMMTAFDTTCLWVKDEHIFTRAFAIDAAYLEHQYKHDTVDLRHYGTPLSRRFRALKLFFMFRMYGLEELQAFIRRVIEMGKLFEKLVREDHRFEVLNDVHLGLVCFRLR
jgi:tyrosine decarboxylase